MGVHLSGGLHHLVDVMTRPSARMDQLRAQALRLDPLHEYKAAGYVDDYIVPRCQPSSSVLKQAYAELLAPAALRVDGKPNRMREVSAYK